MASDYDEPLSDSEKVRIVKDFVLHSPPGEFREVLNDVRSLLNNDKLLREDASSAFLQYAKDQLTPVRLEGAEQPVLISDYNDLGGGRFADPRSKQAFKYDILREEASALEPWSQPAELAQHEPLRAAVEEKLTRYVADHNPHGVCSVFLTSNNTINQSGDSINHSNGSSPTSPCLVACIEDHQFQPQNFWNGRWRSVWTLPLPGSDTSSTPQEVRGVVKVQVHYYEDGNVQLVSSKECTASIIVSSEQQTAQELIQAIEDGENEYQSAIAANYRSVSETTFKALRRSLPVTKSKIDWNKIASYRIGSELNRQN